MGLYDWKQPVAECAKWFMLGRLHSNMAIWYLLTALLTWRCLGETICSYIATLRHGAEYRGCRRSCAQSMFGATVGPAVACEVKR